MKKKLSALLMSAIMVLSLATNVAAQYEVTALDADKEVHIDSEYCNHEALIDVPKDDIPITPNSLLCAIGGHVWSQGKYIYDAHYPDSSYCGGSYIRAVYEERCSRCWDLSGGIKYGNIQGRTHTWIYLAPAKPNEVRPAYCSNCGAYNK